MRSPTASGEREEGALEGAEELAAREDVRAARAPVCVSKGARHAWGLSCRIGG
jgi:hypothetical protein